MARARAARRMDVRLVPGVDNDVAARLASAGIRSVEDLRGVDPSRLSAAGLPASLADAARSVRILTDLQDLDDEAAAKLVAAGIADPDALVAADADDLSTRTGIASASIRAWQSDAQVAPAAHPVHASLSGPQFESDVPTKVLLKGSTASVLVRGEWRAGLAIATSKEAEQTDAALAKVDGDVVVLASGSDEGIVRLGDDIFEGVPLYKERIARAADGQGDVVDEIRVRVEEIRERRAESVPKERKGLLGRLLKRG